MKRTALAIVALIPLLAVSTIAGSEQPESVEAQIAAVREDYLAAWMARDDDAVMSFQAEEIVLLPHRGTPPVVGIDDVREFWFPADSPPWTLYGFDLEPLQVIHEGSFAYAYGRYTLDYAIEGSRRVTNEGNYLTVWRRQPDGRWLRAAHIWNHS